MLKDAKRAFTAVLKKNRDLPLVHRYLAYVALAEGKAKDAINSLETAHRLDPDDAGNLRLMGRAQLDLGKVDDAIDSLSEAVDLDPDDALAHFDLGKALEQKDEYDRAESEYRRAIELEADYPFPYLYLAELMDEIRDEPEEALELYKKYLELGGKDPSEDVKQRIKQLEN